MMRSFLLTCLLIFSWPSFGQRDSVIRKSHPARPIIKMVAAPVALISLGLYMKDVGSVINRFDVNRWRNKNFPNFSFHADNVFQFAPIGLMYGLDALKVKSRSDVLNQSLLLIKTELITNGIVFLLKDNTNVSRPDGYKQNSFPSGHTAQAFMTATLLHKEFGQTNVWYSVGAYTVATSVGVLRVLNNRHWISDVLVGAGIGILSTNLVYATHRYRWGRKPVVIAPTYNRGLGIYLSAKL